MKIISFVWTVEALLAGKKTVTRRFWTDNYAEQFKAGDLVQAYDRSPRFKGKQVAIIRLIQTPYEESLSLMTDEEEKAEGGLWGSAEAFIEAMGGPDKVPWVIRFEPVTIHKEE